MASSTIKKELAGFSKGTTVTLPQTFDKSGILIISINPSTSATNGYCILSDGTSNLVFSVGAGGTGGTFCLPIVANTTVTQNTIGNCNVTYIFVPLI